MIRRRIPLAANAARCPETRQVPCIQAQRCARGTEPHAKGREVYDFSTEQRIPGSSCAYFIAISYSGQEPSGPTVHEPPGWLK